MGKLTLEDIRPYLQGAKQKGAETVATCPLCGKPGHLYIKQDGEKLLLHCQKCNASGTELFKEFRRLGAKHEEPEQINYKTAAPTEDYYHIYRLPNGKEQFRKRRRKWADGHKQFTFEYTDADGKKQFKMPADAVILYNLDKLAEATPETTLYVVEGEKCADAMTKQGLLATTSRTGAQKQIKFTDTDKAALEKFKLKVIIPDNDEKGAAYADAFKEYACKILALPDIWQKCPKKGDVADYFAAGGKIEAITGYEWAKELTPGYIESLDVAALLDPEIFKQLLMLNSADRIKTLAMLEQRAHKLRIARRFSQAWKAYQADSATTAKSMHETSFTGQPLALQCGEWIANDAGIYRLKQQGDIVKKEYACHTPLLPVAVLRNIETDTEKIQLAYRRTKSQWSKCIFPRSTISNKNKVIELADRGISVTSDTAAALVTYLGTCLADNAETIDVITSVGRLGWVDGVFVPYNEALTLDNDGQGAELAKAVHSKGTLEEWAEYITPLREQSFYLQIVLAAAFSSVLISKVKALPFVLHLWGGTGTGKTVALKVAASIWGDPEKYMLTLNGTNNALMGAAALLHDLPLLADELQTIKLDTNFQNYDKLIMQLTEGKDRARLTQQSTLKEQKTWNNCFIFTGEEPITQSNSGGGTKNRVIELQCKKQIVKNGNAVVNFIDSHYGNAGRAFIEHIASKSDEDMQQEFQTLQKALLELSGSSAKQCAALALIALADAYAAECIFKNTLQVLDLKQLATIAKSLAEIDNAERAYRYIMDVIAANGDYFARKTQKSDGKECYYKPAYGACWGKITDNYIAINKTRITEELAKQCYSLNSVVDAWKNKGYIIARSDGRWTHREHISSESFSSIHFKKA